MTKVHYYIKSRKKRRLISLPGRPLMRFQKKTRERIPCRQWKIRLCPMVPGNPEPLKNTKRATVKTSKRTLLNINVSSLDVRSSVKDLKWRRNRDRNRLFSLDGLTSLSGSFPPFSTLRKKRGIGPNQKSINA